RMKRSVTVNVNEEKLSAIEMYLEQKSTTLAAELDKYIEQLYSKVVPQNVRDYIEMTSAKRPAVKHRNAQTYRDGSKSEQ
ncbi:DUF6103 family protein, partial [Ruminococcus bicirculans]|nr:DUF6103 family protein [Ruminococcus bicirculans (ex Wegman et al. 2014)]